MTPKEAIGHHLSKNGWLLHALYDGRMWCDGAATNIELLDDHMAVHINEPKLEFYTVLYADPEIFKIIKKLKNLNEIWEAMRNSVNRIE